MIRGKRKRTIFCSMVCLLSALVIWIAWGNTALELNTYMIQSDTLPEAFSGFRIAHVSDLHNAEMGTGNERLLAMIRDAKPDIIAVTGDLIDSRNTDIDIATDFMEQAVQIAPVYYVTGNHESRVAAYDIMQETMEQAGVIVLRNEKIELERDGAVIDVVGLDDVNFAPGLYSGHAAPILAETIAELASEDVYTLLLAHRPEFFQTYAACGMDLILSGHVHGGQFRIPFVGGVFAPTQGFFPTYDAGMFTTGDTNMIISRGIGNSLFPFRINNRPEVVLVELQCGRRLEEQ